MCVYIYIYITRSPPVSLACCVVSLSLLCDYRLATWPPRCSSRESMAQRLLKLFEHRCQPSRLRMSKSRILSVIMLTCFFCPQVHYLKANITVSLGLHPSLSLYLYLYLSLSLYIYIYIYLWRRRSSLLGRRSSTGWPPQAIQFLYVIYHNIILQGSV